MEKKRIGIVTIVKVNNYGAELQAYATQRKLNLMGYDAELIDYLYYRNPGHIAEAESRPFYPYPLKNRVKELGLKLIDAIGRIRKTDAQKRREGNFDKFHSQHNRFSATRYRRHSELFGNPPDYDAYCVGSDQVWNPRCYTNLDAYFLNFAPAGKLRFSYASSFGVKNVPDSARETYARLLTQMDHISVRESSGVDLVRRLTGKEAELVADPTLLLNRDEWMEVAEPVEGLPERYVLVYELRALPYLMEVARQIAGHRGIKIVRICKDARSAVGGDDNVINITEAGPSHFVYLFDRAECVVTNSFHGTAFSVNFHRELFCVLSATATNNGRQESLLARVGLTDRIIYDEQPRDPNQMPTTDYAAAEQKLSDLREESVRYIKRALE